MQTMRGPNVGKKISPARRGASPERSPGYGRSILSLTFHSDAAHCWNGGPRWWGVGNLFATAAVGNDAQRKKGKVDPHPCSPMPHFLLTFGDASRPPVGAVILEAPSMHHARMTAVVRRLAPGVPFGEGLQLSAPE
jgi:hypothetical protein